MLFASGPVSYSMGLCFPAEEICTCSSTVEVEGVCRLDVVLKISYARTLIDLHLAFSLAVNRPVVHFSVCQGMQCKEWFLD